MPPLKYPRWALTLLATAQLIIALDATIIFVALHDMVARCRSTRSSCNG